MTTTPYQNIENLTNLKNVVSQKIEALLNNGERDKARPLMEARGYINLAIQSLRFGTHQADLDAAGAYLDRAREILKRVVA